MSKSFCNVAVPHTRLGELTYEYDAVALPGLAPGDCVRVPLRGKKVKALVLRLVAKSPVSRTLPVLDVVEPGLVGPELLSLLDAAGRYYFGRAGEMLGLGLPRGIGGDRPVPVDVGHDPTGVDAGRNVGGGQSQVEPSDGSCARSAESQGSETQSETVPAFLAEAASAGVRGVWVSCRSEGREELVAGFAASRLKFGSVIVLVPEPALVGWQAALERLLGCAPVDYSSGLGPARRRQVWRELRAGRNQLVLGVRSAVFAPVTDLAGIVVVDEHDKHFKEERHPRFHARDTAVMRAHLAGCPVLLSDPLPSSDTWFNIKEGSYRLVEPPERGEETDVRIVDMRKHRDKTLAPLVELELRQAAARGQGAVLYINRRGVSRYIACEDCGTALACPDCAVALALDSKGELSCACCGRRQNAPEACPACHSTHFTYRAPGLDAVVRAARKLVPPESVFAVEAESAVPETLPAAAVLAGTAALHGARWPERVGFVAALGIDSDLCRPDFRSREAAFQSLITLARRAAQAGAKLIIQTRRPEDAAVQFASADDVAGFLDAELPSRKELEFAPYRRVARLEFTGRSAALVQRHAENVASRLGRDKRVEALGPIPVRGRKATVQLLVKLVRPARLDQFITPEQLERPGVRAKTDIDPLQLD